jgi:hypothetical protein
MRRFYDIEVVRKTELLPPIFGSIEAWSAYDAGRPCTLVKSRPDIIAAHLSGDEYFSNVPVLEADLVAMSNMPAAPGELALVELRYAEDRRIPYGIFTPASGWPVRGLLGFMSCNVELGAAIALLIYRTYSSGPNVLTPAGELVREMLPHFSNIYRRESPSYIGNEPDISLRGRIAEARKHLEALSGHVTNSEGDDDTDEAGAALEAELTRLANQVDLGPVLVRILATGYNMTSPWRD